MDFYFEWQKDGSLSVLQGATYLTSVEVANFDTSRQAKDFVNQRLGFIRYP